MLTAALVRDHILARFDNAILRELDDAAVLSVPPGRLAFTTDSYVVSPLFFSGGCIGDLAVCGTVNDLAMSGARPLYLSLGLILEEGLAVDVLDRVLDAVAARAREAGVEIVCGDTKVVPRGLADGLYINTAGVGILGPERGCRGDTIEVGDVLIVSGPVGLHGLAVMLSRGGLALEAPVESDVAPLNRAVEVLQAAGPVRAMRDLTRGGLSMALYDLAERGSVTFLLEEARVPTQAAQRAACEILGLDYLHVACEGAFVAVVPAAVADQAVASLRGDGGCPKAAVVGQAVAQGRHRIELETSIGSRRVLSPPRGEQMPRIC